jgi:lipopolysaccharide biosynthesis glycosyltransferase
MRAWVGLSLCLLLCAACVWFTSSLWSRGASSTPLPTLTSCVAEIAREQALRVDTERQLLALSRKLETLTAELGVRDAQLTGLRSRVDALAKAPAAVAVAKATAAAVVATAAAVRQAAARAEDEREDEREDDESWLDAQPAAIQNIDRERWRIDGVLRELNPLSAAQERAWERERKAFVTVATREQYLVGVYALGVSLLRTGSAFPLACLLPSALLEQRDVRVNLTAAGFHFVRVIEEIFNPAIAIGKLSQQHKTGIFTKLRVFDLAEFAQVVYLDGDTVVNRNIDSLFETREAFAVAPEIMQIKNCEKDGAERFVFVEDGVQYCRSHSKVPYHGKEYVYSNSGVMVVRPSATVFDALLALLRKEVEYDDTCIGSPGCNDQRLINMYFSDRAYKRLPMLYNTYCDKFHTERFRDVPFVFHYRGGNTEKWSSVSQGMKPWIMLPGSDPREWQDMCHVFLANHIEYERRWALQQPLARLARTLPLAAVRADWLRLKEEALAAYLQQRVSTAVAFGEASSLLVLLTSNDTAVRDKAAGALVGLGYAAAQWLAELNMHHYIEVFKMADLTPDNLFFRVRKPNMLKDIGVATEDRDVIMNKINADHQQQLLDDKFHARLGVVESRAADLVGIVESVRKHWHAEIGHVEPPKKDAKKKKAAADESD